MAAALFPSALYLANGQPVNSYSAYMICIYAHSQHRWDQFLSNLKHDLGLLVDGRKVMRHLGTGNSGIDMYGDMDEPSGVCPSNLLVLDFLSLMEAGEI